MQQRVALWILGTFWTSPTVWIEAIAGLILIYLYLKKLYNRFHLWGFSFSLNHIIKSIFSPDGLSEHIQHSLSLIYLTTKQRFYLKSLLINLENKSNEFLLSFSPFNQMFSLENWLKDSFPDQFSFHPHSRDVKCYIKNLENITFEASSDPSTVIVISNTNIKNHVATSILHIHSCDKLIIKTIY